MRAPLSTFIIAAFLVNSFGPLPAQAQGLALPVPGIRIPLSPAFTPAHLQGLTIHPDNALEFDFLIHRGDEPLADAQKKEEYRKLVKYFLASLTIPDTDQWVNLSPYEKDRIIKDNFGKTEMGRDLLAQDYLLKQITASLIYPEQGLGQKFWDTVYQRAFKEFGTTNIPVNTFNKVWIIPDQAAVYESGNTVYVLRNHLKVMLEEDYLALAKHQRQPGDMSRIDIRDVSPSPQPSKQTSEGESIPGQPAHALASQVVRSIILPELEREVNEGKNFANLRQIYSGMILATWYKRALKESLLGKVYANKSKIKGVDQDPKANQQIYERYLQAFKKGAFNYIKEDEDKYTKQTVPRKYFSGGTKGYDQTQIEEYSATNPVPTELLDKIGDPAQAVEHIDRATIAFEINTEKDAAMLANVEDFKVLIQEATTQGELKRVYRKMAQAFHPDKVSAEYKEAAGKIFIELKNSVEQQLSKVFNIKRPEKDTTKSKTYTEGDWIDTWASEYSNAEDAIGALKRRAKLVQDRGSEGIELVTNLVSNKIDILSIQDLSDLLDTVSKPEFAKKLLGLTAKGAITPISITDDMIWQARPMIEKMYAARTLKKGEIVHFRKGTQIIRTIILEPISKTNSDLKVITVSNAKYQIIDITQKELIGPNFDLEREPLQRGYSLNIGDIVEVYLSDNPEFSVRKAVATIYSVGGGFFSLVAHDVIHGNMDYMGGHGLSWPMYNEDLLSKIRKITEKALKEPTENPKPLDSNQKKLAKLVKQEVALAGTGNPTEKKMLEAVLPVNGQDLEIKIEKDFLEGKAGMVLTTVTFVRAAHNGTNVQTWIRRPIDEHPAETAELIVGFIKKHGEFDVEKDYHSLPRMINELSVVGGRKADEAMNADEAMRGGIDFNSANLDLQIKRDGKGVPLPLKFQDMEKLRGIEGFVPVIINIVPVVSLPFLSELQQKSHKSSVALAA